MPPSRIEQLVPSQSKVALETFTEAATQRAIYVDYEGTYHGRPPVLVGWEIEGAYEGSIIDPLFECCAHKYKAKTIGFGNHIDVIRSLVERAVNEDRHLVSWSWHELKLIWPLLPRRSQEMFTHRFVNAIRVARRWHTDHFGPGLKKKHAKLSYFAQAVGIKIPDKYGEKLVGSHLSKVAKALDAKGSFASLSPEEKQAWRDATRHNLWDLRATSHICKAIRSGAAPAVGFLPPEELMSQSG